MRDALFIGLAVDGTGAGRCVAAACPLCRPVRTTAQQISGYHHYLVMLSVVGTGLSLPFEVEACAPGEWELTAGQRALTRAVASVGLRFADYVVVDAEFARASFLHRAGDLGLRVVVRLKENLPALWQAAHDRFEGPLPQTTVVDGQDRIELWDADDFDPWDALRWKTVRVLRYRQHKPSGAVIEAYWLTNFPKHTADSRTLYGMAKSRWEIENYTFNDAKNRHGLEHICHHEANSLLIGWLLTLLALVIERLYRLRYCHRGIHRIRTPIELVRLLWLSLSRPPIADTS